MYPEIGDSVWINPEKNIADMFSNAQSNPLNKRVLLIPFNASEVQIQARTKPVQSKRQLITITVGPETRTRELLDIQATVKI